MLIAYLAQFFIGARNSRRICTVRYGLDNLAHIGYLIGIFNDNLACGLLAEISELIEHLLRCSEIERSLLSGIGKALTGHDNLSENAVALVHEVNIAGSDGKLAELVGSSDYLFVYIFEPLNVLDSALSDKESVVAVWLYLQVIVKRGDFKHFIVGFSVEYGSVNFTLFARTADDYTLAELFYNRARDTGLAAEIFEVRFCDYFIEIFKSYIILCKEDYVVIFLFLLGRIDDAVVKIIALHAVEYLYLALCRSAGLGERLNNAVVGYGYRLVSPCYSTLNELCGARNGVHGGHCGMQMKLDAFLRCFVLLFDKVNRRYGSRVYAVALHIGVVVDNTPDHNGDAVFDILEQAFAVLGELEYLDGI